MELKSKHALVTGGSQRIGKAITERLIAEGANVSIHYLNSEEPALALAKKYSSQTEVVQANLRSPDEIKAAVKKATTRFGPVDILVNSASCFYPTDSNNVVSKEWDDFLETNLIGQYNFASACAQSMLPKQQGIIVNIVDSYLQKPFLRHVPYLAAKGGLLAITKALAKEWAPHIRVNAVHPGPILFPTSLEESEKAIKTDQTLLKRAGHPRDIASAVIYFCENEYVTGAELAVDGGLNIS